VQTSAGFANRNDLDPIRTRGKFAEIFARLVVVGQIKIVSRFMPENRFRRWYRLACRGKRPDDRDKSGKNRGRNQFHPHSWMIMTRLIDVKIGRGAATEWQAVQYGGRERPE